MDLEYKARPLTWRGFVVLGAAGAAVYGIISLFGVFAVGLIAGLTIGYLFARTTKY